MKVKSETSTEITPEVMAKAFWEMGTDEQADFFHFLAEETKNETGLSSLGNMQWCYLQDALREKSKQAVEQYMALSAFAFELIPMKNNF